MANMHSVIAVYTGDYNPDKWSICYRGSSPVGDGDLWYPHGFCLDINNSNKGTFATCLAPRRLCQLFQSASQPTSLQGPSLFVVVTILKLLILK